MFKKTYSCISSSQDRSNHDRSGQDSQDRSSQEHYLLRPKMHLRMEFDSGVGPTCLYLRFARPFCKIFG